MEVICVRGQEEVRKFRNMLPGPEHNSDELNEGRETGELARAGALSASKLYEDKGKLRIGRINGFGNILQE